MNVINKKYKKYILLAATIFWSILIFYMSSQPAVQSAAASSAIVDSIIEFLNINKDVVDLLTTIVRKSAHFCEYFIFSGLVVLTYKEFKGKVINFYFTLLVCLVQANLDEFLQKFIEGRSSEVRDVLIDFSGAISFVLIYILIGYIRKLVICKRSRGEAKKIL